MFLKSKIFAASISLALILSASAIVYADTIKLKDGSVIKGKIVSFKNEQIIMVRTGTNNRTTQMTIDAADVEAVEFDSIENLSSLINNSRASSVGASANSARTDNTDDTRATTDNSTASIAAARPTSTPAATNPTRSSSTQSGGLSQVINSQPTASSATGKNKFIPVSIKVLADNTANGWTNTGLVVKKGQRLRVSAAGRISLGRGQYATPAGVASIPDTERLMKTEPTGALIAVIGDDNNDFVFVGATREFIAQRDGTLFLGVNEGNLDDNSGAFDATIEAEAIDVAAQR